MKIVAKAKTTAKSYVKKKNVANAGCDHIKCKLCEYQKVRLYLKRYDYANTIVDQRELYVWLQI